MNRFVLDTDIVTLYQLGQPVVVQRVQAHPTNQLVVSVITVEEQLTGWYTKLRRARKRDELARIYLRLTKAIRLLRAFEIETFSEPALIRYEQLRKTLRGIGKNDLRIAAIALENGDTLVTRNLRDFQQVPGLAVEDWSK